MRSQPKGVTDGGGDMNPSEAAVALAWAGADAGS